MEIRKLGISDIDALMEWRERVLHEVFELPEGMPVDPALMEQNRRFYQEHLANNTHIPVIAFSDGKGVGCGSICLYDEMPSPDNPTGKCAYLMNVYTTPQARGRGIGKAVVEELVSYAREYGAGKIYLETTEAGRPLYEHIGFGPMEGYLKL